MSPTLQFLSKILVFLLNSFCSTVRYSCFSPPGELLDVFRFLFFTLITLFVCFRVLQSNIESSLHGNIILR